MVVHPCPHKDDGRRSDERAHRLGPDTTRIWHKEGYTARQPGGRTPFDVAVAGEHECGAIRAPVSARDVSVETYQAPCRALRVLSGRCAGEPVLRRRPRMTDAPTHRDSLPRI